MIKFLFLILYFFFVVKIVLQYFLDLFKNWINHDIFL